jgi:hypothetical protein
MKRSDLMTVVETEVFRRRAAALLPPAEIEALIDFIAANPEAGVGLGSGVRKVRWAISGRGKSGGVRVIHFFADREMPVIMIDIFAKNEKVSYSPAELAAVRALAKSLRREFDGE